MEKENRKNLCYKPKAFVKQDQIYLMKHISALCVSNFIKIQRYTPI